MKTYVQRALDTLHALDFKLDHADRHLRGDRWVFTHANAPEQRLIVKYKMSDAAASKIIRHAEAIVGLASTESKTSGERRKKPKRARATDSRTEREKVEYEQRVANKERQIEAQRKKRWAQGKPNNSDRVHVLRSLAHKFQHITPARVADELLISEGRVLDAINAGSLEAVMTSQGIRCTPHAAARWVDLGMPTAGAA